MAHHSPVKAQACFWTGHRFALWMERRRSAGMSAKGGKRTSLNWPSRRQGERVRASKLTYVNQSHLAAEQSIAKRPESGVSSAYADSGDFVWKNIG